MKKTSLRRITILTVTVFFMVSFYFLLPSRLFTPQYSTVLEDRNGVLLGARIAPDGQWRFPPGGGLDTISDRYIAAVIHYEDKSYYQHLGVNLRALGRAILQNIRNKRFVSGASTISMQTISLYRGHKSYNVFDKLWEMILAVRLELSYSKSEIMSMYSAHAPFGGNTVGYGAATWRYFGKHNKILTWPEAALLAILPNDPALIHLSKNREKLLKKRNKLLTSMAESGIIEKADLDLYLSESLPDQPYTMPELAPHLLSSMQKMTDANYLRTTCDHLLQKRVTDLLTINSQALIGNQIHNAAICVAEVNSGNILAYVGNIPGTGAQHGEQVDIIQSNRSTGSLLKPFLSMLAVQEGRVTPKTLLTDIPINIDGFRPDNFNYDYEGRVPLEDALRRSLNIPFVLLMKDYNIGRCLDGFRNLGISKLNRSAEHYGLSLIIGGGESSLWEMCGAYASCARVLNHYTANSSRYAREDIHPLSMQADLNKYKIEEKNPGVIDAGAIWQIFEVMSENNRPGRFEAWREMNGSGKIAWKTGTSIGFRDAWAIGVNSKYVVGVWLGNADGEGRPGVIGLETAAPLLFEVFGILPRSNWFTMPHDALRKTMICKKSGLSPNEACTVDSIFNCKNTGQLSICPYDQIYKLDAEGKNRVNSSCYDPYRMTQKSYFILPPTQQFYYAKKHPLYQQPPSFLSNCSGTQSNDSRLQFIYPNNVRKLFLPKDVDGRLNPVTFEVAHKDKKMKVHWHLDNKYLGTTQGTNKYTLVLPAGPHTMTCVDDEGHAVSTSFEAVLSTTSKR